MTSTATPARRLVEELDELHASYASSVNHALETGDVAVAEELAAAYDTDATQLVAEREGRTDMLPLQRRPRPGAVEQASGLRRVMNGVRRLFTASDAHTLWAFNPPASLDPRRRG